MTEKKVRGVCDFVFLIDATGSMGPCMEALKSNLGVFIEHLSGGQTPLRDWRGKVVAYRDVEADGSRWFEDNPFVRKDGAALREQLAGLEPEGGGDEPESLLDALYLVANMESDTKGEPNPDPNKWRYRSDAARVVIVFTDATYHPVMVAAGIEGGSVTDVINRVMAQKLTVVLFAPDHNCYLPLSEIDRSQWYPIPGPDFVEGLAAYSGDREKFKKVLEALAKTVTQSGSTIPI